MKRRPPVILAGLSVLSLGFFLAIAARGSGLGFPLDDAWIHQTYARNLVLHGEWAFTPGVPSSGATSPLWVLLLAPGVWFGLAPLVWSYFLGLLLLFATSLIGGKVAKTLLPEKKHAPVWVAAVLLFEWHLVWAAGSGMETLLFAWFATLVMARSFVFPMNRDQPASYWFVGGILVGLATLTRPEGLTLLAPLLLSIAFKSSSHQMRARGFASALLGFALLFIPYLLFNRSLSGSFWPNTFYAKQAEYASLLERPLLRRLASLFGLPLVGVGALLVPGFLLQLAHAIRRRHWGQLFAGAWLIGFIVLYAIRLPVTFQHGRYLIPVIPLYVAFGLVGTLRTLKPNVDALVPRLLSRVLLAALPLVLLIFWVLGGRAFASDVAFINEEMVAAAEWATDNIPPDSTVAAHDIGALGYFTKHQIVDLAGLVSPDVIQFIRDETRLAAYLDSQEADYLISFPSWYPRLVSRAQLIFQTSGPTSPALGAENIAIYRW
ncbi:MAG: hypothetical protein O3B43_05885 [Chloroflexi bacterium]|nr:hypothetical protein [Chloroflexota bacterium]